MPLWRMAMQCPRENPASQKRICILGWKPAGWKMRILKLMSFGAAMTSLERLNMRKERMGKNLCRSLRKRKYLEKIWITKIWRIWT